MKNNQKYIMVGLFVIIASTILIGVWLWFSSQNHKIYNTYISIFNEAIDGVTNNSVVKYNGVEVGKVKQIELDPINPHNAIVYLNILQNIPLNVKTYATIRPQGITGLAYISLSVPRNAKNGDNIKPTDKEPYPHIPTQTSLFTNLTDQAQSIAGNINDVSYEVKRLINDDNVMHVSKILSNLDKISSVLASRSDDINKSISTMSIILNNVKRNTENLNDTFKQINSLTKVLSVTTDNANLLINNIQNNTLQNINATLLPNLNGAISHLNQSSAQLEDLLRLLNQNPSALVRGKTIGRFGPGE